MPDSSSVSSACHATSFIIVMISLRGSGMARPQAGQGRRTR
jgi:hypothetical protein